MYALYWVKEKLIKHLIRFISLWKSDDQENVTYSSSGLV